MSKTVIKWRNDKPYNLVKTLVNFQRYVHGPTWTPKKQWTAIFSVKQNLNLIVDEWCHAWPITING